MGMNMAQMMKQARKMQEQLVAAQEALKDVTVDASAGGGMVKVTATGDMKIQSVKIDPDALDPEDAEMLEDMVLAAVNEALRSASEVANQQMGAITGGMGMPGMFESARVEASSNEHEPEPAAPARRAGAASGHRP